MPKYTISDIYDVAVAFITDSKTQLSSIAFDDGDISYSFTKSGDVPYKLTISATPTSGNKAKGQITVTYGTTIIAQATTKHSVANALSKNKSDASRFITRIQSPRFFKLLELAEKRAKKEIPTSDNSISIFNCVYRFKENQR